MDAKGQLISFQLNGEPVSAHVAPHQSLIEVLRNFGLHGARESCGQGLCGCCTVTVDGLAVSSCLYLGALVDGAQVSTVEGLAQGGELSPVQQAFVECGAFQCGFCTPGFVMMATQLLELHPDPTEQQIRDYLSGNLCRCATYPEIVQAVKLAALKRGAAVSAPAACATCAHA
jgi:aerobic carbon-monoxide dehydrogenase small subunit